MLGGFRMGEDGFMRDEYGVISEDDFRRKIELADTVEDIAQLRDILEEDDVYNHTELSGMLTAKENAYWEERAFEYAYN